MSVAFNADEVFEMAIRLEQNGVRYYERAAELVEKPPLSGELRELADMERNHETVFRAMKKDFAASGVTPESYDPNETAMAYLHALVRGEVFANPEEPVEVLENSESRSEMLRTAIQREKDSIVFYLGVRDYVPTDRGKGKINDIIQEEMSHVVFLENKLHGG